MNMNKAVTEQELQEKAVAPRVTKEHIDSLMERVQYVTVQQPGDTTSTFVHAFLDGKFFLASGFSACVDKDNFDADIGIRIASAQAANHAAAKLWELEGYNLYTALNAPDIGFKGRLVEEHAELLERNTKLIAFIDKGKPEHFPEADWFLLHTQRDEQAALLNTLQARLDRLA